MKLQEKILQAAERSVWSRKVEEFEHNGTIGYAYPRETADTVDKRFRADWAASKNRRTK